ncbi:MAG: hypothetical protein V4857_10590 [Pseudomonadota bacterium]
MKKKNLFGSVLVMAFWGTVPLASAQETPALVAAEPAPDAPLQVVKVTGVRDPAMMPYEKAFDMLTKIAKVGDGKMTLAIRVVSAQTMRPIPDLEISLQGESSFEKLTLAPEGFLSIPLRQELLADKAVFMTNKKKGAVRAEYFFVPKLPREQLRYGDIAASIIAAKRAHAEFVPWYVRLLVPAIQEVRICYPDAKQAITITNGTAVTRLAQTQQESMLTKETVYCAAFDGAETAAAKESVVTLPPGWTPLFN